MSDRTPFATNLQAVFDVNSMRRPATISDRYSFQRLCRTDEMKLEAFFLALDFDQRRDYFGGGLSDEAISRFCRGVDWEQTTIIACSTASCLDAVAFIVAIPSNLKAAELSVICPHRCDHSSIVRGLLDLAVETAAPDRELLIHREAALPELVRLAHERGNSISEETGIRLRPMGAGRA
jgi:hypothetical protein